MARSLNSQSAANSSETVGTGSGLSTGGPAAIASARVSRAGLLLGALGLASSVFVLLRLVETWRVTPHGASHQISILGQRLSYPTANVGAVVVLLLALLGLFVTAMTVVGTARELAAAIRFGRRIGAGTSLLKDDAFVIQDERPRAFCAGLFRPRVYVSTGAVATLDEHALNAVLVHELHHARRHDPLRLAVGRVLARALFFVPGLGELARRQQALAELSADESAIDAAAESRSALARAMLSFSGSGDSVGIDPARVDQLVGEPPNWRFPALLCLAAVSVIALLVAVAVLAGRVAIGSASLAPPFLSREPCVAVLALIPAAVGFVAVRLRRRVRLGWPRVPRLSKTQP